MTRQTFLKAARIAACGAVVFSMMGAGTPTPAATLPGPAVDNYPKLQHVVSLQMENHSFDNVLGALVKFRPSVDGLTFDANDVAQNTNPDNAGNPVTAYHLADMCQDDAHVSQSWDGSHQQYNDGAMNGFVKTSGTQAMGYYDENDLPATYALAKQFPVIDRWFASTMAQTFPNRLFAWAGSAQGSVSTNVQERAQATGPLPAGSWGAGGTIFDHLTAAGVSWKNYFVDLADSMLWGPQYFVTGVQPNVLPVADFYGDAAAGTLPAFSQITMESFEASEENPQNVAYGETFVWSVANAILTSPAWSSTALIITYDEHGGYYDHVKPRSVPNPGDGLKPGMVNGKAALTKNYNDNYILTGFRVPAIVVSPWAKANYVSSAAAPDAFYDHTSIAAFLEAKYNLPAMTKRDAAANNMLDIFDFSAPSFGTQPALPMPPAVDQTVTCIQHNKTGVANPAG